MSDPASPFFPLPCFLRLRIALRYGVRYSLVCVLRYAIVIVVFGCCCRRRNRRHAFTMLRCSRAPLLGVASRR